MIKKSVKSCGTFALIVSALLAGRIGVDAADTTGYVRSGNTETQTITNATSLSPSEQLADASRRAGIATALQRRNLRDPMVNQLYYTKSRLNFANAANLRLTARDIDRYIDSRITGSMRTYVRNTMMQMMPSERHNVRGYIGIASRASAYSNTWEDLVDLRNQVPTALGGGYFRQSDGTILREPLLEGISRSLVVPYANTPLNSGVFAQVYSDRGFSSETGFISIPHCNQMHATPTGNGTPYYIFGGRGAGFTNAPGSYVDSAVQWNAGTNTVQLYYADSNGNISVGSQKFPCITNDNAFFYD